MSRHVDQALVSKYYKRIKRFVESKILVFEEVIC